MDPVTPVTRTVCGVALFALLLLVAVHARAQGTGPSPVRTTEVRSTEMRDTVRLPGDVAAHVEALLASEVAGLVVDLPARDGTRVRRGDVIARLRSDALELRLEAARGQRTEAKARLDRAERQLGRARDLIASDAIAPEQLDDALSEFNAWQGRQQQLDAEIARIELDIERCAIRALFDGVVVEERTQVGEWIDVGAPVVAVVAVDELEVHVDVPERFFAQLRPGITVHVSFESIPGRIFDARLAAIIPRANANARTFPVELALKDPDARIGIGMLANVDMPVGEPRAAVVVPKDAVVSGPQGRVVWLFEDGNVRSVPVRTGDAVGAWIAVEGEVGEGDVVVVRGNERLRPGMAVTAEPLEYELP